jgi:hypothetical protein
MNLLDYLPKSRIYRVTVKPGLLVCLVDDAGEEHEEADLQAEVGDGVAVRVTAKADRAIPLPACELDDLEDAVIAAAWTQGAWDILRTWADGPQWAYKPNALLAPPALLDHARAGDPSIGPGGWRPGKFPGFEGNGEAKRLRPGGCVLDLRRGRVTERG